MKSPLVLVFLLSLGIGAAPAATGTVIAQKCLEDGKRLDSLANIETEKSKVQFEQALNKYLCAANAGSAEGAYLAVDLSGGGMARPLPDSIQRILSLKAAEGGFNTAYFWLADLDEKVDPSSSVDWLFKARVHDTTGIADQRIAEMYLNGSLGKIDSTVAYGCMKLVFSKKLKKRMLAMRINSPNLDTTKACEQAQ